MSSNDVDTVLIVAKCIVNSFCDSSFDVSLSINSSKVYCKYIFMSVFCYIFSVLIVAKCIVNFSIRSTVRLILNVLIVAKCIVNGEKIRKLTPLECVLIVAKCIVNFLLF